MAFLHRRLFTRSELRGMISLSGLILIIRLLEFALPARAVSPSQEAANGEYIEQKQVQSLINLNRADSITLLDLRGIGPVLAGRIIKYRTLLGGFVKVNQLNQVYGIDSLLIQEIKGRLSIDKSAIRSLDLNRDDFKTFLRHPYLEYKDVLAIFQLRDRLKHFSSVNQLLESGVITDSVWTRISPYLVAGQMP